MAVATGPAVAATPVAMSKAKDRTFSLGSALVFLITLGGGAIALVNAFVKNPDIKLGLDITILGIVAINLVLSVIVLIWRSKHTGTATNEQIWWRACLTMMSVVWDLMALLLAILVFNGLGLYIYLCVVLVTDAVIDIIVHYQR